MGGSRPNFSFLSNGAKEENRFPCPQCEFGMGFMNDGDLICYGCGVSGPPMPFIERILNRLIAESAPDIDLSEKFRLGDLGEHTTRAIELSLLIAIPSKILDKCFFFDDLVKWVAERVEKPKVNLRLAVERRNDLSGTTPLLWGLVPSAVILGVIYIAMQLRGLSALWAVPAIACTLLICGKVMRSVSNRHDQKLIRLMKQDMINSQRVSLE